MDLQVSKVLAATCNDPRHPPSNILNGDNSQFWSTTGLYPQEFILALDDASEVSRLKTFTTNVRHLVVERCEGSNPISWEKMFELGEFLLCPVVRSCGAIVRGMLLWPRRVGR